MGATYCLEHSGIMFTSLLLLTTVGSDDIRKIQSSGIPTVIKSQNPHKMHMKINLQQESNTSLVASVDKLPAPLHPPGNVAALEKPWMIKTENKRTSIGLVAFEIQSRTHSHSERLTNEITETVWTSGHTDPARLKHETLDTKATVETQRDPQIAGNPTTSHSMSSTSDKVTSTSAGTRPSEKSTFGNMYLCDHPPETFSPNFYGSSWETCLQYDTKREVSFRNTMEICNKIYSLSEPNPEPFTIGSYRSNVGILNVIAHDSYVRICQPLFRRFNKCEERNFLTICWEDRVVFFHSSICPHFSNDIFLAGFLLGNNTECFREFCEGRQSVVDAEVRGLQYRLTNTKHSVNAPSCGYMTMNLNHIYKKYNGTLYLIVNDHWPCCYSLYMVIWAGLPEAHGVNGAWSYLPTACQAGEVLLLGLVGCVMVASTGGNLLVLVVMIRGGHHGQESSLLRTSLAFADLLSASFVTVPSFIRHLSPFLSPPTYFLLTPDMMLTSEPINVTSKIYITNSFSKQSGFLVFQSVLFHTTSTASLLMLLMLSVERFVITGRYLRYKDYFSYCRTVLAIAVSWITSLVNAFWFAAHDDGGFATQWLTFEKLPTGASGYGPDGVRTFIYHWQFVLFLMLGISIVTFSALALRNFVKEQMHVAKEWRNLKMKASKKYSQDNRYVVTTMMLMLVLFLTSTIPLATNILLISVSYSFHQDQLFSYFAWWLFMAGSAWNPWVYNFRSHQFKEDLTDFQHQALRSWRRVCFRVEELQSLPATTLPSESSWLVAEAKTE